MKPANIGQSAAATAVPPICTPPPILPAPAVRTAAQRSSRLGRSTGLSTGFLVLSSVFLVFIMCIVGVTGYFRLSSETVALRKGAMSAVPGVWQKKIAVRVGWVTTSLVRAGSRLFNMPAEPRAAIDAVHEAEVGVYRLEQDPTPADFSAFFASTDRKMKSYGWDRVVGVAKEREFVGVYFPHRKMSLRGVKCCVVVLQGRDLVVASANGNLEPLLKLAEKHMDLPEIRRQLCGGMNL